MLNLAYSALIVKLMVGQQSKNQPYKFTSSKCAFALMSFDFIVFFTVKSCVFRHMVLYMICSFN